MKARIAFYKYTKKALNAGIAGWTWLFNPFTPPYSHVEIGVKIDGKWKYFSSTMRDGAKGTRWIDTADLFKHPERWDVYEIDVKSDKDIIDRASDILGFPYDMAGLIGFVAPIGILNDRKKWYCSEACYYVLTKIWKRLISPRRFYSYIMKVYGKTIRRIKYAKNPTDPT